MHRRLSFKPTCVGLSATRTFTLHNPTRTPLVFKASMPSHLARCFAFSPKAGVLRGYEDATISVVFAPRDRAPHEMKLQFEVRPLAGETPPTQRDSRQVGIAAAAPVVQRISAHVLAPGTGGVVAFEPPLLEYDTLLVNTTESRELTLVNTSDCDVQYTLSHVLRKGPESPPDEDDLRAARGSFDGPRRRSLGSFGGGGIDNGGRGSFDFGE